MIGTTGTLLQVVGLNGDPDRCMVTLREIAHRDSPVTLFGDKRVEYTCPTTDAPSLGSRFELVPVEAVA